MSGSREMQPRTWHKEMMVQWERAKKAFLLNACPGSGKTFAAALAIKEELEKNPCILVVVVVPSDNLKDQWRNEVFCYRHIHLNSSFKRDEGLAPGYHGVCVTYQQLPNVIDSLKQYSRASGRSILLVLDEAHHCADERTWGAAVLDIGHSAYRVLLTTGTPFRCDGLKIPFVEYDQDGYSIADFNYSYRRAIAEKVNRKVMFDLVESSVTRTMELDGLEQTARWTECSDPETVSSWIRSGLEADMPAATEFIEKAWAALQKMIRDGDDTAACGIHCMSSTNNEDESDTRYVNKIAQLVRNITGCNPVVVYHGMDDAAIKLKKFKESKDRFLVSIRQFTEGTNIPRARVGVWLNNVTAELSLLQAVGRYTRYEAHKPETQYAVFIMPKVPVFIEFATKVENEWKIGLIDRKEKAGRITETGTGERATRTFTTTDVTVLGQTTVISGQLFDNDSDVMIAADRISPQFPGVAVGLLASVIDAHQKTETLPPPVPPPARRPRLRKTLDEQMKELSEICNDLAFQVHIYSKNTKRQLEVSHVNYEVNQLQKVRDIKELRRKHGLEGLQKRRAILQKMLEEYR